ncbi:M23 family metallopeptidase [Ramlibacter ginsenosidimutans]|uniref:M23 family metallopeptidase n=1 Tax=Ramlibacter ginsenosidimutans TaxID=502333 RepID=A0A934TNV0_9BURK|nr:M23 family metallopeptidase [Ramlibacter ginsenosidimutans]MBK6004618.1 M23 family metallopeptidase [Ramlibacter ginsenosidimutans]
MHFIITDARMARSHAIHLSGTRLVSALVTLSLVLMLMAAGLYHWVFLKGARERWPVVGTLVRFVVHDEMEQRDRFMRENLDAMARRLGEMQARMLQLDALGERVGSLAGVSPQELHVNTARGGALVEGRPLSLQEVKGTLDDLDQLTGERTDLLTVMESRLIDQRLKKMMVPTQVPVSNAPIGSRFGWRIDPFTGRQALHTGLDYQAVVGSPIVAAAGGIVVTAELHPEYGNMVEIDHGNGLVTRYGHASKLLVKKGDLIKRGQQIALVGTTGRSTGPHLHFEVLVQGVQQDPQKFLAGGGSVPAMPAPAAPQHVAAMVLPPDHRPH